MDESEDNLSTEEIKSLDSPSVVTCKSKKRTLVERELETNLTARVTSPITNGEGSSTSRYGRARRLKTEVDSSDSERSFTTTLKSPKFEKSPIRMQSPVYKMHASNSPLRMETPKQTNTSENKLDTQIENIYNENMSLSRFGSEERKSISPAKKFPKVYIRKDLIQSKEKEKEDNVTLIKNIFSPVKLEKPSNTHSANILERSSEKYSMSSTKQNGYLDTSSVVKTLDFDGNKKKKKETKDGKMSLSKNEIFEMEAKSEYQVGDLAWARMGTYPFWPCIITRDPVSGTFVKKKLFGRIERDVLHVTFFGDNGRRGWIVDNMLRKFLGQLEFETTREMFTSEAKKRDPRLYAAFFISEKKLTQWTVSVEEAEALLREPKRLRIDILRDMLEKSRSFKTTPKTEKSKKVTRTNSDVSLSESLYDTLFSEDDTKTNDNERSKSKTRNKSFDVSDVVTACLDNMAAKTGITKIQRQSHMDRWLQKAKSKTPEKSFFKSQIKTDKESKSNNVKHKTSTSKETRSKKSLSLKRCKNESQDEIESKLLSHQNEHDYSRQDYSEFNKSTVVLDEISGVKVDEIDGNLNIEQVDSDVIANVENLCRKVDEENKVNELPDVLFTVANEEFVVTETENNQEDEDTEPMQIDLCDTNSEEIVKKAKERNNTRDQDISYKIEDDTLIESNDIVIHSPVLQKLENIGTQTQSTDSEIRSIDSTMTVQECGEMDTDVNMPNLKVQDVEIPIIEEVRAKDLDNYSREENVDSINIYHNESPLTNANHDEDSEKFNLLTSELEAKQSTEDQVMISNNKLNALNDTTYDTVSNQNSELEVTVIKPNLMVQCHDELDTNIECEDKLLNFEKADIEYQDEKKLQDNREISCDTNNTRIDSLSYDDENCVVAKNCIESAVSKTCKESSNICVHIVPGVQVSDISLNCNLEDHETVNIKDIVKINEENLSESELVRLPEIKNNNSCIDNIDTECEKSDNDNKNSKLFDNHVQFSDFSNKSNNVEENEISEKNSLSDYKEEISQSNDLSNIIADGDRKRICEEPLEKRNKPNNIYSAASVGVNSNIVNYIKEKNFLNERCKEKFDAESESVDSDYNEELFSNDPQSELDPENDVKENLDQKFIDNLCDSVFVNSESREISESKRKQRTKLDRQNGNRSEKSVKKELEDPEFLKYLELRQDALIDENPQLTQEEITNYLYKTWLYEESAKSDRKKTDDIEQATLVKGLNQEPTQPKKVRKKIKVDKELCDTDMDFVPKSKSKRKLVRQYYNEDISDIENELQLFDIFNKKTNAAHKSNSIPKLENESENTEENCNNSEPFIGNEFDQVEEYFEQLTRPKPNLFKGLIREKVCEICEKTGNLVKCKGCHSMFHTECTSKETEVIEAQLPSRGRKKKKRNRGRKQKTSEDSNGLDFGSQSDDKSQDPNGSEENLNVSIDDIDPESHIVVDADSLEAQLCAKMKEMFDALENEYFSDSSENELDWSDTEAGKCKIIDINLPSKNRNSDITEYADFKCNKCQQYDIPVCFVCKSATSPRDVIEYRQRCQVAHCNRYYHLECLDHWPQTQFSSGESSRNLKKIKGYFEPMSCPRHVCHTCVCDDPRGCKTRFSGDKLARCIRCPATYHSFTQCLPAGTQILTGSQIICPRHYKHRPGKVPCHVNTGWCFICALGGSLICCEYCPTSFHAECLNIKPPEGGYMCEDCETGRLPLYGEMVWVKLGHYRWWPGIILHPSEIPANILAVKHSPGEFVVRFFGQYDHYWVNRGRVFPFQEGDSGKVSSQKSKIDAAFTMAMEHAQRACEILKNMTQNEEESIDIASSLLPPHYVKLKVNKPVGSLCGRRVDIEESSLTQCECNPDEEDPCGLYSQCLNRMLLTECGPSCRAGDRCSNRAFEKRQYPKLVPYRTPHRGWGLKTLEDIRAGQFVIEYVGELIDEEEFKRRMIRKHEIRDENYYFLTLDKERMIDAGPKGNPARFMNHCCEPNCETQKWTVLGDVRVGLFAMRDIPANSEVTFNYNLQCAGIEKKRCLCGAKRCSGYIGAKPKQNDPQPKKNRKEMSAKRPYKKRKNIELSPTVRNKTVTRRTSRSKPRELTDIEKDLLIIKNATNGMSSDSDCSGRLSSIDSNKETRALKRRRVGFSTEEVVSFNGTNSPITKRFKMDEKIEVGD